jgi:hypothetical protein
MSVRRALGWQIPWLSRRAAPRGYEKRDANKGPQFLVRAVRHICCMPRRCGGLLGRAKLFILLVLSCRLGGVRHIATRPLGTVWQPGAACRQLMALRALPRRAGQGETYPRKGGTPAGLESGLIHTPDDAVRFLPPICPIFQRFSSANRTGPTSVCIRKRPETRAGEPRRERRTFREL